MYNITQVGNSSGVLEFVQNINTHIMDGWFGVMILIAIGGVLLLSFLAKTNNAKVSFAATSFICFGLSIFLRALNLVPDLALFICLFLAAFSVAALKT